MSASSANTPDPGSQSAQTLSEAATSFDLALRTFRLGTNQQGHTQWIEQVDVRRVAASRTLIIICDMWDNHWSRGAAERVTEMAPRLNAVVAQTRIKGAHIIHAPSNTLEFYAGHPARQRILDTPHVEPPVARAIDAPPLPIDDADEGSDTGETETYRAWTRQHPAIEIDSGQDGISDQGHEVYSYICAHQIQQVLLMGVHTNMCILNRSFAIKQMVRWGIEIALVRDLTDAMYNPARRPYVSHADGTALVIGYIERFWCPTISSHDLAD